jgi:HD superfamily phosphohydrolase
MEPFQEKVLRDPVHGNIVIPHPALLELMDSPELQRLRRIRQLGMCFTVYHGAEHSRFPHVLGVMWLMHRILERWQVRGLADFPPAVRLAACAAALLHDVGHGPFSHAMEHVFTGVDHEAMGRRIVGQRLAPILARHDLDPDLVLALMEGGSPFPVLEELLSSQLDVDRMDYLRRDSLHTGVQYGLFDTERILFTLMPVQEGGRLVTAVHRKGVEAVEEYLFSRYFMHWQVYLHRTVRASEVLLRVILLRARQTHQEDPRAVHVPPNLEFLFSGMDPGRPEFLEGFLQIDDFDFFCAIKLWRDSRDPVLADLARRFVERRPFKALPRPPEERMEEVRRRMRRRLGSCWEWYLHEDTPTDLGFGVYEPGGSQVPIRVLVDPPDGWLEISQATRTDAILALGRQVSRPYLMVAPECREEIAPLVEDSPRPQGAGLSD